MLCDHFLTFGSNLYCITRIHTHRIPKYHRSLSHCSLGPLVYTKEKNNAFLHNYLDRLCTDDLGDQFVYSSCDQQMDFIVIMNYALTKLYGCFALRPQSNHTKVYLEVDQDPFQLA